MPNWCINTLTISGDSEHISRLPWTDTADQPLLFNSLLPCPQGLTAQEQYDWSLINWGVKWDTLTQILSHTEDSLELQFNTAWNSPKIGIGAIAAKFPSLDFELSSEEPGADWKGFCYWEKGKLSREVNGTFYQQSAETCPNCGGDYYPEIDLDGNITYSECFECGWTN